jgi:hypothetical protein
MPVIVGLAALTAPTTAAFATTATAARRRTGVT